MKKTVYSYDYNKVAAIVEYGDFIVLAFETSPIIVAAVYKTDPNTIVDALTLDIKYSNVSDIAIDGTNIWVLCNTSPGYAVVIDANTKECTEIALPSSHPKRIIFDNIRGRAVIGTEDAPGAMMFYDKDDFSLIHNITTFYSEFSIKDLTIDTTGLIWAVSGNSQKFFRVDVDDGYNASFFDLTTISAPDKAISITVDESDYIWIGTENNDEEVKLIKAYISSGDILNETLYTWGTGLDTKGISSLKVVGGYIYMIEYKPNDENCIMKGYIDGGTLQLEYIVLFSYEGAEEYESAHNIIIDVESSIWTGWQSSPGQLIKVEEHEQYTFNTNLTTRIKKSISYATNLEWVKRFFTKLNTDIRTLKNIKNIINTDCRVRNTDYDSIEPKGLDNTTIVK